MESASKDLTLHRVKYRTLKRCERGVGRLPDPTFAFRLEFFSDFVQGRQTEQQSFHSPGSPASRVSPDPSARMT